MTENNRLDGYIALLFSHVRKRTILDKLLGARPTPPPTTSGRNILNNKKTESIKPMATDSIEIIFGTRASHLDKDPRLGLHPSSPHNDSDAFKGPPRPRHAFLSETAHKIHHPEETRVKTGRGGHTYRRLSYTSRNGILRASMQQMTRYNASQARPGVPVLLDLPICQPCASSTGRHAVSRSLPFHTPATPSKREGRVDFFILVTAFTGLFLLCCRRDPVGGDRRGVAGPLLFCLRVLVCVVSGRLLEVPHVQFAGVLSSGEERSVPLPLSTRKESGAGRDGGGTLHQFCGARASTWEARISYSGLEIASVVPFGNCRCPV